MIVFEFEEETKNAEGVLYTRPLYWCGSTSCTGADIKHEEEIYEQLDAEICGLVDA